MSKERLYYNNQGMYEFEAVVASCDGPFSLPDGSSHWKAKLMPNAFYPESGGQPSDRGHAGTALVLDVIEDEEGEVVVIIDSPIEGAVRCSIDKQRRFDHMQQHTGQHILSAAFEKLFGYETVGFHLGEEYCTIDLDTDRLNEKQADEAENVANEAVFGDLAVHADFVDKEQLSALNLRKTPKVDDDIRIVEVEGFDRCPCGGTHVSRTGEVGIIKVTRIDRAKGRVRLEFLCGRRALEDYRRKNRQIASTSSLLSVHPMELESHMERLLQQMKDIRKALFESTTRLIDYDAAKAWQEALTESGVKVVILDTGDGSMDTVKQFALRLVAHPYTAAAVGAVGADNAYIAIARSQDLPILDSSAAFRAAIAFLDGKGGGSQSMAQGGGPNAGGLVNALEAAKMSIISQLQKGDE